MTSMTFIGGGRACIGFKFSEMEMSEWFICLTYLMPMLTFDAEVMLYTLVDLFRFHPSKEIFWNHIGISTPSVEREKLRPELPLIVSLAP